MKKSLLILFFICIAYNGCSLSMDSDNIIRQFVLVPGFNVTVCKDVGTFLQNRKASLNSVGLKFKEVIRQRSLKSSACNAALNKVSKNLAYLNCDDRNDIRSLLFRLLNRINQQWVAVSNPRALRDTKQRIIGLQNELEKAAPSISKKSEILEPIDEKSFREKYFIVSDHQDDLACTDLHLLAIASERVSL